RSSPRRGEIMIRVKCPGCGEENEVQDAFAGMRIRCKNCPWWVQVPTGDTHSPVCPGCGFDMKIGQLATCPACGRGLGPGGKTNPAVPDWPPPPAPPPTSEYPARTERAGVEPGPYADEFGPAAGRQRQQMIGAGMAVVCGTGWAWGWSTALTQGYYYPKAATFFPAFFVLAIVIIVSPGYKEEQRVHGEDISGLSGHHPLTRRGWWIVVAALAVGFGNRLLMGTL
ncbi:MAG TPA: hypothetical protein VH092_06865, partial [Urbifossiella sp.]|nr:hypothetical protein [Urbifossiella sp.]